MEYRRGGGGRGEGGRGGLHDTTDHNLSATHTSPKYAAG